VPHPQDLSDLALAPVALAVDARLQALSLLSFDQLSYQLGLQTDQKADTAGERAAQVVAAAVHMVDLHGWRASWDPRGIRLSHSEHSYVLGVAPSIQSFVADGVS
jgi:hypothetical protein